MARGFRWKTYFILIFTCFFVPNCSSLSRSGASKVASKGDLADDEPVIELVDRKTLQALLNEVEHLAVFFYDGDDCPDCEKILRELENIDDDTDQHDILFVSAFLFLNRSMIHHEREFSLSSFI